MLNMNKIKQRANEFRIKLIENWKEWLFENRKLERIKARAKFGENWKE